MSKLLRYPIRKEFFTLPLAFGDPIILHARSVPRIYWAGLQTFEREMVPIFLRLCQATTSFIDIGANAGVFSMLAYRANRRLRIVAVEPNPQLVEILDETFRRNAAPVDVVAKAVSDNTGTTKLSLNEGLSSIVPARWGGASLVEVPTITFDQMIDGGAGLVKIDAEGAELLILDGMRRSLHHDRPHVLIELTDASLEPAASLVREYGYSVRGLPDLVVCEGRYGFGGGSADFLMDPCGWGECRSMMTLSAH